MPTAPEFGEAAPVTGLPAFKPQAEGWPASLQLEFRRRGSTTLLARNQHFGPLRVQKPLYPEGPELCHALVLHPPAGICGGDQLTMNFDLGPEAQALVTTPGAGKWYGSAGSVAIQQLNITAAAGAMLEWLPQESIVFDGALARLHTRVQLATGARFIGIETLCLGRRASGERFTRGRLGLATEIWLDGQLLWLEQGQLDGGSPWLRAPAGLAGFTLCSTVLAAGRDIETQTLAACRQIAVPEPTAQCGVTALPNLLIGRYLGHSSEAARHWFIDLWRHLRPALFGRSMLVPRIWNT